MLITPEGRQLISQLSSLDRELTQQRRLRLALRATWIALLAVALCLGVRYWLHIGLSSLEIAIIGGLVWLLGLVYAFVPARHASGTARALDRAFGLDANLATALELSARGEREGFAFTLTDEARRKLALIIPDVRKSTAEPLRLELQTLALALMLCAGMLLITTISHSLPAGTGSAELPQLPELPAAVEPPEQQSAQQQQTEQTNGGGQAERQTSGGQTPQLDPAASETAAAIADALRDNGATRAAADALDRGDTQAAASAIRQLADRADQLSPAARNEIADSLQTAADKLSASQPEQAQQLQQQARAIREGGSTTVRGLEDLAQSIDNLNGQGRPPVADNQSGDQSGQPQPGSGSSSNATSDQPEQAGSGSGNQNAGATRSVPPASQPGQDVPLPPAPDPEGQTTPGGNGSAAVTLPGSTSGSGGSGAGTPGGNVADNISDPATIPPELRDAIQNYFEH